MNQSTIKKILTGTIIGDALGMPLDGLSKAHIHSVFKEIGDYTDAGPGLKGHLQDWKKPGLYSSLSQMIILLSASLITNKKINGRFTDLLRELPETAENEYSIFRHPGPMLKHYIAKNKNTKTSDKRIFSWPCTDAAIIAIPFSFLGFGREDLIYKTTSFAMSLTADVDSITAALILISLLSDLLNPKKNPLDENILYYALNSISVLKDNISAKTAPFFEIGINPDYIISAIEDYVNILEEVKDNKSIDIAEKKIYSYVNRKIKTPVTRATVNIPKAILPFAIYHAGQFRDDPSRILYSAAMEGGASSVFCALTGAITGAIHEKDWIPDNLLQGLVNKKRIAGIIDSISSLKNPDYIHDFIDSEASLTSKEIQEMKSKLKHVKIKIKKQKSRRDIESELSAHVVESWTKLDRAKWRRKIDKDRQNEPE